MPLETVKALDPALKAALLIQKVATPPFLKAEESSEACHKQPERPIYRSKDPCNYSTAESVQEAETTLKLNHLVHITSCTAHYLCGVRTEDQQNK